MSEYLSFDQTVENHLEIIRKFYLLDNKFVASDSDFVKKKTGVVCEIIQALKLLTDGVEDASVHLIVARDLLVSVVLHKLLPGVAPPPPSDQTARHFNTKFAF